MMRWTGSHHGSAAGQPTICITKPYNGKAAVPGNGNMVAIVVKERAQVDALHAKALALGGTTKARRACAARGTAGVLRRLFPRPDGNKLCAFRIGPASSLDASRPDAATFGARLHYAARQARDAAR